MDKASVKLDIVYFDAGGGHRSTAHSLVACFKQRAPEFQARLVNLQELLEPIDIFRKVTGRRLQDLYNLILEKGWTLGSPLMARFVQFVIAVYHRRIVKLLQPYWSTTQPDLVLSVIPNFNRALFESLQLASPRTVFVTLMTDFADYPPHFWIERQPQYLICGTDRAYNQCLSFGHPPERVFRISGMVIHPKFYEPLEIDRREARQRLGLAPDHPTALVFFGGFASSRAHLIAHQLARFHHRLQAIFLCGRSEKLVEQLRTRYPELKKHVEPYTDRVPYFMSLCDFMIGKPGPGAISEALVMGLPVIVEHNAWTLPQERYNAQWVVEKQVGFAVKSFRRLGDALEKVLDPEELLRLKQNVQKIRNRAVFEVVEVLREILRRHDASELKVTPPVGGTVKPQS